MARRQSMTFGTFPTRDEFDTAFDEEVSGSLYHVLNDPTIGNESFTSLELWWKLHDWADGPEEEASLASAIMGTLGFEWI